MIVSHRQRFIFIHIPKCAGTSLRRALQRYHDDPENFWYRRYHPYFGCAIDYAHMRLWELTTLFPHIIELMRDYETLALVRSPYERFISALAQHLTAFHPDFDYYAADRDTLYAYAQRFIEEDLRIERVIGDSRFIHFSYQTWYVFLGQRRLVRHVLPVPSSDQGWADVFARLGLPPEPIGHANPRGGALEHLLKVDHILDWIENFYKSDFDWLARDANLARLTARPRT